VEEAYVNTGWSLVFERSKKWMLFSDSIVGFCWMMLWIVSTYCRILYGLGPVES